MKDTFEREIDSYAESDKLTENGKIDVNKANLTANPAIALPRSLKALKTKKSS